jgi:hypothetical protein
VRSVYSLLKAEYDGGALRSLVRRLMLSSVQSGHLWSSESDDYRVQFLQRAFPALLMLAATSDIRKLR